MNIIKGIFINKRFRVFFLSICLLLALTIGGFTLAYFTDVTNVLANSFQVDDLTTHIDEKIDPTITGNTLFKQPSIVNDGSATAFIRARVTVSPDYWNKDNGISLQFGNWENKSFTPNGVELGNGNILYCSSGDKGWFYYESWYYYNRPVPVGQSTTPLFDAVVVDNAVNENFDITIYQEAVASKAYIADETRVLDYEDITQSIKNQGDIKNENVGKSVIAAFDDVNKSN